MLTDNGTLKPQISNGPIPIVNEANLLDVGSVVMEGLF
jgi:hypothetical protein